MVEVTPYEDIVNGKAWSDDPSPPPLPSLALIMAFMRGEIGENGIAESGWRYYAEVVGEYQLTVYVCPDYTN